MKLNFLYKFKISLGFEPIGTKIKRGDGKTPEGLYYIEDKIKEKFGKIEVKLQEGISLSSPNKINEENKLKDIENSKIELSNDSEIKNFLDEFDGEIEVVTKIKN